MAQDNIQENLVEIALDRVEGFDFERFAQAFLSGLEGKDFVPIGGIGDGGADGLYSAGDERYFYQFTRQENHRDKVRRTVRRLREYGRDVSTVYYLTSRHITKIDTEEDLLSEELDVRVKIRDSKYITSHINDSVSTQSAFHNHLASYTEFLSHLKTAGSSTISSHVKNPSAYVFLQHEATTQLGDRKLVHALADSMITWALSETDPDKGLFLTERQIDSAIFDEFPWAQKILKGHIHTRLKFLRNKKIGEREVRWYRKENKYCLPHETRKSLGNEAAIDEHLRLSVIGEIEGISSNKIDGDDSLHRSVADLALKVVNAVFETQGLVFSHFLDSEDESLHPAIVSDCIEQVVDSNVLPSMNKVDTKQHLEAVLREIFYNSTPNQRQYLSDLSKTYLLLFTLQAEPKLVEFFSTMSSSFSLYIGTDILVKALSERYLSEENQVARNLLKLARLAGVEMFLSERVLDEVYTHIRATYFEFRNYFVEMEPYVTQEIARNSDKILIRSYFYAKFEGKVSGWKSYLSQFLTYENVESNAGRQEIKTYLLSSFDMEYVDNSDLAALVDEARVKQLAEKMLVKEDKENEVLAYNTALLVHGIYGLRRKNGEAKKASEYGLKTWWITNQTRVLRHTQDLIQAESAKFLMRPEFLLNFLAIAPSCDEVRNSFKNIFPSTFGVQLGHRLDQGVFHSIMNAVKEWKDYEPARVIAKMGVLSDNLKTRRYDDEELKLSDVLPPD